MMYSIGFLLIFIANAYGFNLTILHTNDVHARYRSFNKLGGPCSSEDLQNNFCFGGAARRMTAIKQLRSQYENVILLDGGDQFQGTIWYTVLKYQPITQVMNALQYDAMAFGNHEFDDGLDGLLPFIEKLNFPVVNSNIDSRGSIIDLKFQKTLVKSFGFERVGIVGYTTVETPELSAPGDTIRFLDVVSSLRTAVDALKQQGINKIIAVGHAGISKDKEICKTVPGIDLVVGGHTNTFLYSGTPPSGPEKQGNYPLVFTESGSPCLVVQDYAFGKYLGFLQVQFNEAGILTSWNGNPILLDRRYREDPQMNRLLAPYASKLQSYEQTVVGRTAVALDGDRNSCRLKECNLGNVMADAAILAYLRNPGNDVQKYWSPVAISLINGGGVRDFVSKPWTNLTLEDIYTVMPFGNTIEKVKIKGKYIWEAFEHSVKDYSTEDSHGKFLQISGLRVLYDLSKSNGKRVQSVQVRCADCIIPEFAPINLEETYALVTTSYIISGGDGYRMIRDNIIESDNSELLDIDAVRYYLKKNDPIIQGVDGRISFVSAPPAQSLSSKSGSSKNVSLFFLTIAAIFYSL